MKRVLIAVAAVALAACSSLPRALRDDIAGEIAKLDQAKAQMQRAQAEIDASIAKSPDLFSGTSVATEWPARLRAAALKLDRAQDARVQLEKLHSGDRETARRAERLLEETHRQRQAASDEIAAVQGEAARWLDFRRNLPGHLSQMEQAHARLQGSDLNGITEVVDRAERDWPAKRPELESRLNALRSAPERAETQWQATETARQAAASGQAQGRDVAALITADNAIQDASGGLERNSEELRNLAGQLYESWDKILEDLEITDGDRVYREKVKTVRTKFVDVAAKKTETTTEERWEEVSPAAYRAVEEDLGMSIAHKDAGLFDSEAQTVPQPPGYAYIAPPGQSNQYGYWSNGPQGSFWTFLPQYLIMRELFWGRSYSPIYVTQYNTYYSYRSAGRTWYGQESPQAAPKYGSHGTFTQSTYSNSRYVQSGGYKGSGYASRPSSGSGGAVSGGSAPRTGGYGSDSSAGRQFGKSSGEPAAAAPAGRRFGSPGGSAGEPAAPSAGRRFGGGSGFGSGGGSRTPSRSFGSRRR